MHRTDYALAKVAMKIWGGNIEDYLAYNSKKDLAVEDLKDGTIDDVARILNAKVNHNVKRSDN